MEGSTLPLTVHEATLNALFLALYEECFRKCLHPSICQLCMSASPAIRVILCPGTELHSGQVASLITFVFNDQQLLVLTPKIRPISQFLVCIRQLVTLKRHRENILTSNLSCMSNIIFFLNNHFLCFFFNVPLSRF